MRGVSVPAAVVAALLAAMPAGAGAAVPELETSGRWLTDPHERVVILHGVQEWGPNRPLAGPLPFGHPIPDDMGYGRDDAEFMAANGFNAARLSLSYWGHAPGAFDDGYLDGFRDHVRQLARSGVYSLLDMQQAVYGPKFAGGEGFPEWMTLTDGVPNQIDAGYPNSYFVNLAMNRAWDNLWANAAVSGAGLQDHFASGWRHLARRFEGEAGVLGYDVINEPWPGTAWALCANVTGCPPNGFDESALTPLYERVTEAIREVDRRRLIVYEPNLLFDFGADTRIAAPEDSRAVFGFHNYCLAAVTPGIPAELKSLCGVGEDLVHDNAEAFASRSGDALLMGEWGGISSPEDVERELAAADRHLMPWMYWWYGRMVLDPEQAPASSNLDPVWLDLLVRPYPQAVAGTPLSYSYDPEAERFELRYDTSGPTGRDFAGAAAVLTTVFVPRRHFGREYRVEAVGAEVVPGKDPQRLLLRACRGAAEVTVTVTDAPPAPATSCAGPAPGKACANRIVGTPGGERITGTLAGDSIGGRRGRDRLAGLAGSDCLRGGRGSDTITGGRGRDRIRGGRGADTLRGGRGRDVMTGGRGHDRINCGPGRDLVVAAHGDRLRRCERVRIGQSETRASGGGGS